MRGRNLLAAGGEGFGAGRGDGFRGCGFGGTGRAGEMTPGAAAPAHVTCAGVLRRDERSAGNPVHQVKSLGAALLLLTVACETTARADGTALHATQDSIFRACQLREAQLNTAFRAAPGWTAERADAEVKRQVAYC